MVQHICVHQPPCSSLSESSEWLATMGMREGKGSTEPSEDLFHATHRQHSQGWDVLWSQPHPVLWRIWFSFCFTADSLTEPGHGSRVEVHEGTWELSYLRWCSCLQSDWKGSWLWGVSHEHDFPAFSYKRWLPYKNQRESNSNELIIESLKLRKITKIIQSNHQSIPTMPTSTFSLNTSRDSDSTTPLGSLCQCLTTLSEKQFLLIFNVNLLWHNLRPIPLFLWLGARDWT